MKDLVSFAIKFLDDFTLATKNLLANEQVKSRYLVYGPIGLIRNRIPQAAAAVKGR